MKRNWSIAFQVLLGYFWPLKKMKNMIVIFSNICNKCNLLNLEQMPKCAVEEIEDI